MKKPAVVAVTLACLAQAAQGSGAQTGADGDAENLAAGGSRSILEEVLVTARRTEERMQDVPVAMAALSGDDLRREQINSPQDLQGRVPSLVVGTNSQMRNTESPTIRGQGAQFGASPGVVIYLGEVPLPADPVANYQGGAGKFFDLSSVQILKGAQGTLFGRNTTGGALLLEPHRPEENFTAAVRVAGSYIEGPGGRSLRGENYEAVVNVPVIEDTLFLRAGGQVFKRDGFTEDVVTGKDYDNKDYWVARLGVLWRPHARIENYLMANYARSDDNGTATVIEEINREGLNRAIPSAAGLGIISQLIPGLDLAQTVNLGCLALNLFGPSSNCGQDILDEQAARGNRRVQLSGDPRDTLKSGTYLNNFSFELTDNLTLRNILSYSTMVHSYRWDLDGSRAAFNEFVNPSDVDSADVTTVTAELQLEGYAMDGALNFVVGGFYEDTEASGRIIGTSLLFVEVDQQYEQERESLASFAQFTYELGHLHDSLWGLSLTMGARHTRDKNSGTASIRQEALGLLPLVDNTFDARVSSSALTYTAGLDYQFGSHLLYGKVSRGYKSGGISPISVNPAHYTYEPEFVTSYEVGQKSDFEVAGMPVRLNSALYYTDYTDMQTAAPDAFVDPDNPGLIPQLGQAVFNVGEAWVAGAELDLMLHPARGLTLLGTYGYTRAEYEKFELQYFGATPQLDCSGQERESGELLQLRCLPFRTTPKHQFSLSARYLLPLNPAWGDIEASTTYTWVDTQYSAQISPPDGEPGAWLPSFGLVNASVSWSRIFDSRFSARIFGTNLANKEYRISNSNQWNLTYFRSSIYSEPRVLGFQLSYEWG